jgi:hypothetical protein
VVETWTVKAILIISKVEMKNKVLETGGKATLFQSDKELDRIMSMP